MRQQDTAEQAAVEESLATGAALSVANRNSGCVQDHEHKTEGSPAGCRTGQGSLAATGDGRIKQQSRSEIVLVATEPCMLPPSTAACLLLLAGPTTALHLRHLLLLFPEGAAEQSPAPRCWLLSCPESHSCWVSPAVHMRLLVQHLLGHSRQAL